MIAPSAPEEKAVEANGEPPQVTEEKKSDEEVAEKVEEPAKEEEEKKDEEKTTEEETKEEEKKEEVVATKGPNPISVALDACCGLVCKVVGMVTCLINQVLNMINLVKDKVLSLPWACIISLSTTLGIEVGFTYGSWLLTQDQVVYAFPVINLLGKFIVEKLGEKKVLEAKGVHTATEILETAKLGIKYYLYRTYISQPIWDEAPLPAMTPSFTDSLVEQIPISAEDGRNGALVFVSAISMLSGVAPIAG